MKDRDQRSFFWPKINAVDTNACLTDIKTVYRNFHKTYTTHKTIPSKFA